MLLQYNQPPTAHYFVLQIAIKALPSHIPLPFVLQYPSESLLKLVKANGRQALQDKSPK